MNKTEINQLLPKAYDLLKNLGIANDKNEIIKTYRGYISSFGAAVSGGSLLPAIAFFSDKGGSDEKCDRTKLMQILYLLVGSDEGHENGVAKNALFKYIKGKISQNAKIDIKKEAIWKERVINAAIAVKLAMNLYKLV